MSSCSQTHPKPPFCIPSHVKNLQPQISGYGTRPSVVYVQAHPGFRILSVNIPPCHICQFSGLQTTSLTNYFWWDPILPFQPMTGTYRERIGWQQGMDGNTSGSVRTTGNIPVLTLLVSPWSALPLQSSTVVLSYLDNPYSLLLSWKYYTPMVTAAAYGRTSSSSWTEMENGYDKDS
jgi:hypothetical protein